MQSATVGDFESTIRTVSIKDLRRFMAKMLELCANKGAYVNHFGTAMDNFAAACRCIAEDTSSPRLGNLIRSLFSSSKISSLLEPPTPPQIAPVAAATPLPDQPQAGA